MPERKGVVIDARGIEWVNYGKGSDTHLSFGGHEPAIVQIAEGLLPAGGTFLDVGAHVGLYSLNLAEKASRVYAIEANPMTYDVLLENIEHNKKKFSSEIHSLCLAAWDVEANLALADENGYETGGSTFCLPEDVETPEGAQRLPQTTQAMPLDSIIPVIPKVDLIKIDVEGAEARVLYGLQRVIANDSPTLLIEMHDETYGIEGLRDKVIEFLEKFGYEWNDALKHGGQYYIVARMPRDDDPKIEIVKAGE